MAGELEALLRREDEERRLIYWMLFDTVAELSAASQHLHQYRGHGYATDWWACDRCRDLREKPLSAWLVT